MSRLSRAQKPLSILLCHGLESGPGSAKHRNLEAPPHSCECPDMRMSLWSPLKENSVVRSLPSVITTHPPGEWLAAASFSSLGKCVDVASDALRAREADPPDVLVGSSWGGYVALVLVAEGVWSGPTVVLCPALRLLERHLGKVPRGGAGRSADALTERLCTLGADGRSALRRLVIVHGTEDETVPIQDSRRLAEQTGCRLVEVAGGDHPLRAFVADGSLRALVEETADSR